MAKRRWILATTAHVLLLLVMRMLLLLLAEKRTAESPVIIPVAGEHLRAGRGLLLLLGHPESLLRERSLIAICIMPNGRSVIVMILR